MILQKEKENHEFAFISEVINAWNTFWNITKLTIICSEKPFSKNSYYTETSQMICNARQLARFQTDHIFSERYFQTDVNPFPANVPFKQIRLLVFISKMFEKTCGRVAFKVKMQVINLYLYLKCHSTTDNF